MTDGLAAAGPALVQAARPESILDTAAYWSYVLVR
jgi:hypothetical protein